MPRYKAVFAKVMPGAEIKDIVATLKNIFGDLLNTVKNPLLAPFTVVIHAACNEMTSPKKNTRRKSVMLTEFTPEIFAAFLEYCEIMQAFPNCVHKRDR